MVVVDKDGNGVDCGCDCLLAVQLNGTHRDELDWNRHGHRYGSAEREWGH